MKRSGCAEDSGQLLIWMSTISETEGYSEKEPKWRRNPKRPQGLDGKRRTVSFTSWLKCCHCRRPSPPSWTKRPSSGWRRATWRWESFSLRVRHERTVFLLVLTVTHTSTSFKPAVFHPPPPSKLYSFRTISQSGLKKKSVFFKTTTNIEQWKILKKYLFYKTLNNIAPLIIN